MSPTARTTNDATSTTPLRASADRGVAAICAVTAVRAANTDPAPTRDIANAMVPAIGSPLVASTSATPAATAMVEMSAQSSAAAVPAYRPTGEARVNSAFSVVSSVRVWRTTTKMFIRATAMAIHTESSFMRTAPRVGSSSPYPGPAWTISVVLPRTMRAYCSSWAGVEYSPVMLSTVRTTSPTSPPTQSTSLTRSRRSASRSRCRSPTTEDDAPVRRAVLVRLSCRASTRSVNWSPRSSRRCRGGGRDPRVSGGGSRATARRAVPGAG